VSSPVLRLNSQFSLFLIQCTFMRINIPGYYNHTSFRLIFSGSFFQAHFFRLSKLRLKYENVTCTFRKNAVNEKGLGSEKVRNHQVYVSVCKGTKLKGT
jgi:hypothetical protein